MKTKVELAHFNFKIINNFTNFTKLKEKHYIGKKQTFTVFFEVCYELLQAQYI